MCSLLCYYGNGLFVVFFIKQKTAYEMRISDWSSDVCSSDLIVYAESVRIGGDKFDESIVSYVRRQYNMLIGEATAERIKIQIGTAFPGPEVQEIDVVGRHLAAGVPRNFTMNSNEILDALQEPLSGIVQAVKQALERKPP